MSVARLVSQMPMPADCSARASKPRLSFKASARLPGSPPGRAKNGGSEVVLPIASHGTQPPANPAGSARREQGLERNAAALHAATALVGALGVLATRLGDLAQR